nr:CTTNBP2 N-terminal-like protein [Ipomoea batatas]
MATNPVPQGNHPSNVEEQENLEKLTLAQLAKQTHTRQILRVPDFLNVVDDKNSGNQKLCTYPFSCIYEKDVAEFYLHSSIDNLSIKSIVNETHVEIMPSDLRDMFDLPETDLEGIKFNWAGYVYNNIVEFCKNAKPDEPFVLKKLQQHVGYGFVISEIMRKKGVTLRKPKNVASFKYLFRNPKTLRRRKSTETSTTSSDTVGSNAPKKKRGRPAKRTSRISEGLGSNVAPLVVMESENDGANILEKGSEPFFDEDPTLAIELLRVKEWRKWRLEEYKSHISRVGPEIEREELFALDWLGTRVEEQDAEPNTIPEQDQVTVVVENLVEACATNEVQFEVPVENLIEEPVEKEITAEVEEQVMIPNVIDEEHWQDFESDEEETSLKSTKRRKIIMSESSNSSKDDDVEMTLPTEDEGMQLIIVPIHQKERELATPLKQMKKNLTKNIVEDDENLLNNLFIKVNECQEDISTRIANAMEVKGDIQKHIYEDIYKQMTSLSDHQKNLNNVIQEHNEKKEKVWDEGFAALSKKIEAKRCRGFASKDPRQKFGAIQYFSDDRTTPYTMKDVPAIMRKQPEGDQRLWIAKKNQELNKGKSPANSDGSII